LASASQICVSCLLAKAATRFVAANVSWRRNLPPHGGSYELGGTAFTPSPKQCSRHRKMADHNCSPNAHDQTWNGQWFLHAAFMRLFFVAAGVSRQTNLPPYGGSY